MTLVEWNQTKKVSPHGSTYDRCCTELLVLQADQHASVKYNVADKCMQCRAVTYKLVREIEDGDASDQRSARLCFKPTLPLAKTNMIGSVNVSTQRPSLLWCMIVHAQNGHGLPASGVSTTIACHLRRVYTGCINASDQFSARMTESRKQPVRA